MISTSRITHIRLPISSKCQKYALFSLLLLLNLVLRIPSIPHEKGYDSFTIHSLANSISTFGGAEWWINWLSVFGFYPYSYASAVPFVLSGMHQLTAIEMELAILLYCIITGMISIFTGYILAGKLSSNFIFKYGIALFFSIAPGMMLFSTWEVSSRGLFIILLPVFLFLLLSDIKLVKKVSLIVVLFIFQFSIHHYGFVLIPIIVLYAFMLLIGKTKYLDIVKPYSHYLVIFLMTVFVVVPFLNRSLIDSGSRYGWIIISALSILRQVGPAAFLAAGGFTYILFKKQKSFIDLLLLGILTMFIPAIYSHLYGAYILLLFIILFTGVSFLNITSFVINKRIASIALISLIVVSAAFAGYYNHYRTGDTDSYWYMGHDTYVAGIWGRNYVPANSYGLDVALETGRMFSISEGHPITPGVGAVNLAYGFINESQIELVSVSHFDKSFYFEGPYIVKSGTTVEGRMEWLRQAAKSLNDLNDFSYFVQDRYYSKPVFNIVSTNYNKVYENSRIAIWHFDYYL